MGNELSLPDWVAELLEEEEDADMEAVVAAMGAFATWKSQPLFKWQEERCNWDNYVKRLEHKKEFDRDHRMSLHSFNKLVRILEPSITVDYVKSMNSTPDASGPIFPELVVATGIRWLAGGVYSDITKWSGMSSSSFYRIRDMFLDAVIYAEALQITWPKDQQELDDLARGFKQKSTHSLFRYCVGALDGILIRIRQPRDVPNPRDYFSGHYQAMGLNVQAVCDASLRFTYLTIGGPGKNA